MNLFMKYFGTSIKLSGLLAVCASFVITPHLEAQPCAGDRDRPAVCTVELFAASNSGRPQRVETDSTISVPAGGKVELTVDAYDQFKRRFPAERLAFGHQLDDRCRGLISVRELQTGKFEIRGTAQSGSCRMWLWVPGNMNLEWPLELQVSGGQSQNQNRPGSYSRSQSETLATCLYQGLLGRDPDPAGLRDTVADIEKGKLGERVREIANSTEYATTNRGKSASQIVTQLYSGILRRQPDAAGMATFMNRVKDGGVAGVTLELVRSEEFERRVLNAN